MRKNLDIKRQADEINRIYDHSDKFLGKDILTIANKLNSSRSMMFHSHLEQAVVLNNPDFPRVFTNYENMVGEQSSSYFKAPSSYKIIAKISKFSAKPDMKYVLVVQDKKSKKYDVIERNEGIRITEHYAYKRNNDVIDSKKTGDTIKKGDVIYRSTAHDENMNYCYGKNAKVCYLSGNKTIEDAIVCSESFAKSMTATFIEEVEITVNTNDVLCNIYTDDNILNEFGQPMYKCFPDVGEDVKDKILAARRRLNYESFLYDMQSSLLRKVSYNNDNIFYTEGTIIDIDIYSNQDIEELDKKYYNEQIIFYLNEQEKYYQSIYDELAPIVEDDSGELQYTDKLAFLYKKAKEYIDPQYRWCSDNNTDFDNIIIKFKVMVEEDLKVGSKLTGRSGNKGTLSYILPDEEMPTNEYGEHADLVLNPLGVVNRLNPNQLFELELNFMSDNIIRKAKTMKSLKERANFIIEYITDVNKTQGEFVRSEYDKMDSSEKKEFIKDLCENGIMIHQPPFWDNVNFDELKELYNKYDFIKPYECTINGKKIKKPLIMGDLYFLRLKHDPSSKLSARSTSFLNMKRVPSKSKSFKKKQELYSKTPIRLGRVLPILF